MADYPLMPASEIAEGDLPAGDRERRGDRHLPHRRSLRAYRNRCPHDGGPVCAGTITGTLAQGPETGWQPRWERDGEILYCPWHGSDFDLCTGRALSRKPLRLKSYPVRVENGTVTITV